MPKMTNRNILIAIVALIVLGLIVFYFPSQNNTDNKKDDEKKEQSKNDGSGKSTSTDSTRKDQTKAKTFVSSDPANNALLKAAPEKVSIKFSSNLDAGSTITVVSDKNIDVVPSGPVITADLKTLYVPVEITDEGTYKVEYKACFQNGSCSDGSFGFSVDLAK